MRCWSTLFVLSLLLFSCQKEDLFTNSEIENILISTSWKLDKYIYYFQDGSTAERDTLVLTITPSDSLEDTRAVYKGRWLVFENDTFAVTAYTFDWYYRPKGEYQWFLERDSLTGVAGAIWGRGDDLKFYMNPGEERPVWIDLRREDLLILRDVYQIETIKQSFTGDLFLTYIFGEFPVESLDHMDAHYRSASLDEGPHWSPYWEFWQW